MKRITKILTLLFISMLVIIALSACGNNGSGSSGNNESTGQMTYRLIDGEVYAYNANGERVTCNDTFVEIEGEVYYAINNRIVYNQQVIDGAIYDFGTDGKRVSGKKGVYNYGEDGKLIADELFVTVNGDIYFVVNNVIVYNQIVINDAVYDFGADGKMVKGQKGDYTYGEDGRLIADNIFVNINGDVYYVVADSIVYKEIVIDGAVYCFGDDGKMVVGEWGEHTYGEDGKLVSDGTFVNVQGYEYYVRNNAIVYNQTVIDGAIYDFGEDGKKVIGRKGDLDYGHDGKLIGDEMFVEINGDVYFVVNNVIVYNQTVIDGAIYDFGEDGKMVTGRKGDLDYGRDGKLIGDEMFVEVNGNVYFVVNNVIVYNEIIIDGSVYDFGEDGKMVVGQKGDKTYGEDGKLIGDEMFVEINGDVYFVVNNVIVYNEIVIDGAIYDFGEDGKMVVGQKGDKTYGEDGKLIADEAFITINGDVYFVINNVVVYNQFIIDGSVYDFGEDGKMVVGQKGDKTYGEDGKLIADKLFVTINGDVYFVVNNTIVYNEIIIDGGVYDFGDDGKMVVGQKGDKTYGEDGKLIADEAFITINGDVYFIINNVIVYNQIIINGDVYDFGDDGKMVTGEKDGYVYGEDGKLVANKTFITVNGNVYYIVNNVIVYNTYVIHNGKVYYLTENGTRLEGGEHDGYEFGSDGSIIADDITITIDGVVHRVVDNQVLPNFNVNGTVYESDNDFTLDNNGKLEGVQVTLRVGNESYTATSDLNGYFEFVDICNSGDISLEFVCNGYVSVTKTLDGGEENLEVIMDKAVSNTLAGTIYVADADSTITNNSVLSGALITLERTSSSNVFYSETTTNSSGYYSFTGLTAGVYTLTVSKDGYIPVTQTVQVRYNETTINNVAIEMISSANEEGGYASGYISDALTGSGISGLTVYIYEGINTTFGTPVEVLTTGSSGFYATSELNPGNYTAYVVDERTLDNEDLRYASVAISLKVLSGQTASNQNATTTNSVNLNVDGMRIVLTWGSTPSDLDSHLTYGGYHCYHGNKSPLNATLDKDDTTAYGPETITITKMGDYTYNYYVYNYSGNGTMYASQACVKIYFGDSNSPAYTFYAPTGSGRYWEVFSYNASTGEFTILNYVHY